MSKFKVKITRVDTYEITVDESVWTPEEIADWEKTFFPALDAEDIAKHLAYSVMRNGSGNGFMEGWGYVKTLRSDGTLRTQIGSQLKPLKETDYSKGLSVRVISEDSDYEEEVTKIS